MSRSISLPATPAPAIALDQGDNVLIARHALAPGLRLPAERLTIAETIPAGHKLARAPIATGGAVRKFGEIIARATCDIAPGEHVHIHNCRVDVVSHDPAPVHRRPPPERLPARQRADFDGYLRDSGRVGTRNYIGVLTSVNCAATVARQVCRELERSGVLADFPNVDGVVPLTHSGGCGMAADGDGIALLRRALCGYATHPNFAAVLIIGLGCEVNQIPDLLASRGLASGAGLQTLTIQGAQGTRRTIDAACARIIELLPSANAARRRKIPASELILALQCGGSDAFSAITANPALGVAADRLVANGGTAILSETPEIYGAEHLLIARAARPAVGAKLRARITWWERYVARHGGEMSNNPSPGNHAGGITTIVEKSLGAIAKGGSAPLTGVYLYGEPITSRGLVFMDSPGFDPCSVTGQVAAGANLVCFTTGRGSVFGCKPVPSLKIASNSALYRSMPEDMDLNAGSVIDGTESLAEVGGRIFTRILEVASGARSCSEQLGFGDDEFIPWQIGAVM